MLDQLIEYVDKIFLEKFGPRPTVVYDIGRETVWKFCIPPIYNFAILKYSIFLKRSLLFNRFYYLFHL